MYVMWIFTYAVTLLEFVSSIWSLTLKRSISSVKPEVDLIMVRLKNISLNLITDSRHQKDHGKTSERKEVFRAHRNIDSLILNWCKLNRRDVAVTHIPFGIRAVIHKTLNPSLEVNMWSFELHTFSYNIIFVLVLN